MGIFSRLGEIVNANISSMLDRAEDPMKMVKLMIHEMEDTLTEIKSSAAEVIADRIRIQRKHEEAVARVEDWQAKAGLALSKGREDLAREALEQKLLCKQDVDKYATQLVEVEALVGQYQEDIQQLEDKLAAARRRQQDLENKRRHAEQRRKTEQRIYQANSSGAFHKFEEYERKVDRMQAEAEVSRYSNGAGLDRKFAELEQEGAVDAELEKLKQQQQQKD